MIIKNTSSEAGFTLIEVMIVVVVVAILSAIAVPNYTAYVKRGYRADAMAALLQAAARMQQGYTLTNSYLTGAPATFTSTTKYTISLSGAATASTFTLQAAPLAPYTDAKCGTFTVDQSGLRSVTGATATAADCWAGK